MKLSDRLQEVKKIYRKFEKGVGGVVLRTQKKKIWWNLIPCYVNERRIKENQLEVLLKEFGIFYVFNIQTIFFPLSTLSHLGTAFSLPLLNPLLYCSFSLDTPDKCHSEWSVFPMCETLKSGTNVVLSNHCTVWYILLHIIFLVLY